MEPTPFRDIGPYETREQAWVQLAAATFGIPTEHAGPGFPGEMVLMEALHLAGVQVGGWEDVVRQEIVGTLSPEAAQVIAGWLLRAHLAGSQRRPG